MKIHEKYWSSGQNTFDTLRAFLFVLLIGSSSALILDHQAFSIFLWSLILASTIALVVTMTHITTVERIDRSVSFKDLHHHVTLRNVSQVETWWNYEFSSSSRDITSMTNNRRAHANKIHIYAKISNGDDYVVIYEQILLSEKFPNNHPYSINMACDQSKMLQVWDVDKCIEKLKLLDFNEKPSRVFTKI